MPDKLESLYGEIPGQRKSEISAGPGIPESETRRLRELAVTTVETLSNPDCDPETGRILVDFEFLRPREELGLNISSWEAGSVLVELKKRAEVSEQTKALIEVNASRIQQYEQLEAQIRELRGEWEKIQDGEEKKKLEGEIKKLKEEQQRYAWIYGVVEERRAASKSGEREKWERVFRETRAAIGLQAVWWQRTKLEGDVDNYAERLFFSSMEMETLPPSKIVALLETPDIEEAIEKALEIYIDIHLDEDIPEVKKLQEELIKSFGIEREKEDGSKKSEEELYQEVKKRLKILQSGDVIQKDREVVFQFVKKICSNKSWAGERGELLARHLATVSLLSVWLGVKRDPKTGGVEYEGKFPELGICTFEGESQSDLIKLLYFRLKTISDLNKNRPAGPPALATALPEYLTEDFFHFTKVGIRADGSFCFYKDKKAKEVKSVFEAWYKARKEGKEVKLADVLKMVDEGAFSFWVYCMFRQNRVKSALWEMDRDKMLIQLWYPEFLRALNKDFGVAFGERIIEREITKINLVAARVIAWTGPAKVNTEIARADKQEITISETWLKYVRNACIISGFLNEKEWSLVLEVINRRRALTVKEIQLDAEIIKALTREGEIEKIEQVVAAERLNLRRVVEEIKSADEKVRKLQEEFEKVKDEARRMGRELTTGDFERLAQIVYQG